MNILQGQSAEELQSLLWCVYALKICMVMVRQKRRGKKAGMRNSDEWSSKMKVMIMVMRLLVMVCSFALAVSVTKKPS